MTEPDMEQAMDSFAEATKRCCLKFLDDFDHNKGHSPMVNGPCDDCCHEVIREIKDGQ